jgi:hypothetical protein
MNHHNGIGSSKEREMGLDSVMTVRPQFGGLAKPYNPEAHVQECVAWISRVLKPVDELFFYWMVEELLADQPETIRLEVQSRIYQLIPRTPRDCESVRNPAWHLD